MIWKNGFLRKPILPLFVSFQTTQLLSETFFSKIVNNRKFWE